MLQGAKYVFFGIVVAGLAVTVGAVLFPPLRAMVSVITTAGYHAPLRIAVVGLPYAFVGFVLLIAYMKFKGK